MPTGLVPNFSPREHGFPFPNWFPPGSALIRIPTPLGTIPIGDANGGVCGGMVFAAMDFFTFGVPRPPEATPPVFRYLAHRLLDSFNLPFGFLKYYDWMRRPSATRTLGGLAVQTGVGVLTRDHEWPRIQAELRAGRLVPLGLVQAHSLHPKELGRNHQVLAYGYQLADDGELTIDIYDPNHPNDNDVKLHWNLNAAEAGEPLRHSIDGPRVRGIFVSEYRRPAAPPVLG